MWLFSEFEDDGQEVVKVYDNGILNVLSAQAVIFKSVSAHIDAIQRRYMLSRSFVSRNIWLYILTGVSKFTDSFVRTRLWSSVTYTNNGKAIFLLCNYVHRLYFDSTYLFYQSNNSMLCFNVQHFNASDKGFTIRTLHCSA